MKKGTRGHFWANYNGPGKPLTPTQLMAMLEAIGIKPRLIPQADGSVKAFYYREDFEEAFARYLPPGDSRR
jgi:hypothetical protein